MNTQNQLVSVIVPMYNVEEYIQRCVDSILHQSYNLIEIILVDDCSKDHTLEVCKKLYSDNPVVHIFESPQNEGVSVCRNQGILKANGEWIAFVDADDYIFPSYIDELIKLGNSYPTYTPMCMMTNKEIADQGSGKLTILSAKEYCIDPYVSHPWAWAALFKRSLIIDENIYFNPQAKFAEDSFFVEKYISNFDGVIILERPLYFYFLNENGGGINKDHSKITEKDFMHRATCIYAYRDAVEYVRSKDKILAQYIIYGFCFLSANVLLMSERASGSCDLSTKAMFKEHLNLPNLSRFCLYCKDKRHILFVLSSAISPKMTKYLLDNVL